MSLTLGVPGPDPASYVFSSNSQRLLLAFVVWQTEGWPCCDAGHVDNDADRAVQP